MCAPLFLTAALLAAADEEPLQPIDVFEIEWASDPQISPDGKHVVYVRSGFDVMTDQRRSSLWIIGADGTDHRPLLAGDTGASSPRWSPDGGRLVYVASDDDGAQVFCRWMDTGQTARLTQLTESPGGLSWSPDGRWIAFSMLVPEKPEPMAEMPPMPEGAEWAEPPKVIEKLRWRADGAGMLADGFQQLFVLPAEGGTPRQLTSGPFDHGGTPSWTPAGDALLFSANRNEDGEYDPMNSEVYRVSLEGEIAQLTDRPGPDGAPVVSPDGEWIAYVGFDDKLQSYHSSDLYLMRPDGSGRKLLTGDLDRSVSAPVWDGHSEGLFFRYDDEGNGKIGWVSIEGDARAVARDVGGTSLGRPYGGGSYSVADDSAFAFTYTRPDHPSDVAIAHLEENEPRVLTRLNADLFGQRELGAVEEIWTESSFDGRRIQGWIVKPPGFDPSERYPLVLEIHGGPFANYGDRFTAECQLFAAAGYVVLYSNPRGSTSYGEEFANLIHHNYPSQDYDDLMSIVDATIARGYVDPEQLFVTGGSGGGVLTSWIVGKTDRFRAAVVAKPVINWTSFALTADAYPFFYKYWFPGFPWEHQEHYWQRSPLSLVGNVKTPTMLLTGEEDHRTPISESEQYYQALKLRKIDAALVRVPGASHGIAARPSQLIAKVAHILAWFERYREKADGG